jgi:hypothetical protein
MYISKKDDTQKNSHTNTHTIIILLHAIRTLEYTLFGYINLLFFFYMVCYFIVEGRRYISNAGKLYTPSCERSKVCNQHNKTTAK